MHVCVCVSDDDCNKVLKDYSFEYRRTVDLYFALKFLFYFTVYFTSIGPQLIINNQNLLCRGNFDYHFMLEGMIEKQRAAAVRSFLTPLR